MLTNERVQSGAAPTATMGGFGGTDGAALWKSEPKAAIPYPAYCQTTGNHTAFPSASRNLRGASGRPSRGRGRALWQEATTYLYLENYANRLARHLRTLKMRPGAVAVDLKESDNPEHETNNQSPRKALVCKPEDNSSKQQVWQERRRSCLGGAAFSLL